MDIFTPNFMQVLLMMFDSSLTNSILILLDISATDSLTSL